MAFILFLALRAGYQTARADLYIWTNEEGVPHVSNIAPPRHGTVVKMNEETMVLPQGQLFVVDRVYDGDTVRLTGAGLTFKVRLVGIDAPETGWRGKPGQPYGKTAPDVLSGLILNRKVMLRQYGTGGYNRILAEILRNTMNVNIRMLQQGLAEVYRGKIAPGIDIRKYRAAEAAARGSMAGIWSQGKTYKSPRQWRRENPRK